MGPLRVLLVEDEPLVSMILDEIIEDTVPSVVVIKATVQEAKDALVDLFHFALLDVDVTNGKTFDVARLLFRKQIPYVFVSGSNKRDLPEELQSAPFIRKPFKAAQIENVVLGADQMRRDAHSD